jgi:hypothetical protein
MEQKTSRDGGNKSKKGGKNEEEKFSYVRGLATVFHIMVSHHKSVISGKAGGLIYEPLKAVIKSCAT